MEQQLTEAARTNDVNAFRTLIRQNPNMLEEIDKTPFVETPLHVAASNGKTRFAEEMMVIKPSFSWKLNVDGYTPLHLAVQQGYVKTAIRFLHVNHGDIVRVKGKDGFTPFLCAVELGHVELLLRFLFVCPKAMEDVTTQYETCLHLALRNNQLEAFKVLVGWIELGCDESPYWEERIVNLKDNEDHTILDLAMSREDLHEVVLLLSNSPLAKYFDVLATAPPHPSKQISFPGVYTYLLRTDKRLKKAAYEGDTSALYAILREDSNILDHIDGFSFANTPLHIAASAGQTRFAKEIMKLKPSFAKKLNQDGFSAVHLAVKNLQSQTAIELVGMDNELVSIKGKENMTPLHSAAEVGDDELLDKFLEASPQSIEDVTVSKESVLHIAVKYQNWKSLKFLWRWVSSKGDIELLGWTDDNGNNIGDIAEHMSNNNNNKIHNLFKTVEAPFSRHKAKTVTRKLLRALLYGRFGFFSHRQRLNVTDKEREILLVVYTLIATTTYQAVLSPPGGVWQGDTSLPIPSQYNSTDNGSMDNSEVQRLAQLAKVGTPVMDAVLWMFFSVLNTITFIISLSHICYMLPSKSFLSLPLSCWALCYAMCLVVLSYGLVQALTPTVLLFWWLGAPLRTLSVIKDWKKYVPNNWPFLVVYIPLFLYALYYISRLIHEGYPIPYNELVWPSAPL